MAATIAIPQTPTGTVATNTGATSPLHFSTGELMNAAIASSRWPLVVQQVQAMGSTEENARRLVQLLITNTRVSDDTYEFHQNTVKKLFTSFGLSKGTTKQLICSALAGDGMQQLLLQMTPEQQANNNFFRLADSGARLDANHLAGNVYLKRDGFNEVLNSGTSAIAIAIRALSLEMMSIVIAQLDKARRYDQAHRQTETERIDSNRELAANIQTLIGASELAARGRVRKFAQQQYDALGVVDKSVAGYGTATQALATVAQEEQIVPRKGGVAANLTTVGKDAMRWMTSAVTQDVVRRMPQIQAATSEGAKKRLLTNAMNERVKRLKKFNVFHEDPSMVGEQTAEADCAAQATYYLNQPAEKRTFE